MPITGITSLYGQGAQGYTGAGALESQGSVASPRHGQWGDLAGPAYAAPGWNATLRREANQDVYTTDFVLADEYDYSGLGAGDTTAEVDQTPYPVTVADGYAGRGRYHGYELGTAPAEGYSTHAGPYPRTFLRSGALRPDEGTLVDDQWTEQESRRIVHEVDLGAGRTGWTAADEPQVHRRDLYSTSSGGSLLQGAGSQLQHAPAGGASNALGGANDVVDTVQADGTLNDYGFGGSHNQNYRQQTDSVPFNFNWLDASERPFIPKGQATNMAMAQTLNGPDSPYGAAGDQTDYSAATFEPAMVQAPATAYQAPPDPTLAPAYDDTEDVWAYGG